MARKRALRQGLPRVRHARRRGPQKHDWGRGRLSGRSWGSKRFHRGTGPRDEGVPSRYPEAMATLTGYCGRTALGAIGPPFSSRGSQAVLRERFMAYCHGLGGAACNTPATDLGWSQSYLLRRRSLQFRPPSCPTHSLVGAAEGNRGGFVTAGQGVVSPIPGGVATAAACALARNSPPGPASRDRRPPTRETLPRPPATPRQRSIYCG